jgi:anti-sigma factor RsiW
MLLDEMTLMAYCDGELPAARRRDVELALAADEELAHAARCQADSRLGHQYAFEQLDLPPVPEDLCFQVEALAAMAMAADNAADDEPGVASRGYQRSQGWAPLFDRLKLSLRPWLGWIVVGQFSALALLVVGMLVLAPRSEAPQQFRLLGASTQAAPAADVITVVVLFDGRISEGAVRQILNDAGAHIVNGPTESGAYFLRLPAAQSALAIDTMRHQPGVTLVEPMGGEMSTR